MSLMSRVLDEDKQRGEPSSKSTRILGTDWREGMTMRRESLNAKEKDRITRDKQQKTNAMVADASMEADQISG